jgi:sensor histidine kinase regulating citrate/malate metabolism
VVHGKGEGVRAQIRIVHVPGSGAVISKISYVGPTELTRRQIVEEHGGTIRAESTPGQGTSVCIHLPGAPPRPATA